MQFPGFVPWSSACLRYVRNSKQQFWTAGRVGRRFVFTAGENLQWWIVSQRVAGKKKERIQSERGEFVRVKCEV